MTTIGKVVIGSFIFAGLCSLPLLLYVIFGPKDGNPIGLGLLMVGGWFLAGIISFGAVIASLFMSKRTEVR